MWHINLGSACQFGKLSQQCCCCFFFFFCFGEANIFESMLHKCMPGSTKEQIASLYSSSIKETKPYLASSSEETERLK